MAVTIALRILGAKIIAQEFQKVLDAAFEEQQRGNWYVVSVVEYAEILEFRTPHWRVAIQSLADEVSLSKRQQQDYLNAMVAGGGLTKKMVKSLESRIKKLIRFHGLIDTGNYIGSIAIGPSLGQAIAQSQSQLLDPDSSVVSVE